MLNKIDIRFTYDGTTQGDSDRDALETACDTELAKATVIPSVTHGVHTETSQVVVDGDLLTLCIFYENSSNGASDQSSFYSSLITEFAKSTVVKTNSASSGNKHRCGHDSHEACSNFTYLA